MKNNRKYIFQERILLIVTSFKVWTLFFVLTLSSVLLYNNLISSSDWKHVTIFSLSIVTSLREVSKLIALYSDKLKSVKVDFDENDNNNNKQDQKI